MRGCTRLLRRKTSLSGYILLLLYPPEKSNIKLDNENVLMKTIMQALIIDALKIQSLLALIPGYGSVCRRHPHPIKNTFILLNKYRSKLEKNYTSIERITNPERNYRMKEYYKLVIRLLKKNLRSTKNCIA